MSAADTYAKLGLQAPVRPPQVFNSDDRAITTNYNLYDEYYNPSSPEQNMARQYMQGYGGDVSESSTAKDAINKFQRYTNPEYLKNLEAIKDDPFAFITPSNKVVRAGDRIYAKGASGNDYFEYTPSAEYINPAADRFGVLGTNMNFDNPNQWEEMKAEMRRFGSEGGTQYNQNNWTWRGAGARPDENAIFKSSNVMATPDWSGGAVGEGGWNALKGIATVAGPILGNISGYSSAAGNAGQAVNNYVSGLSSNLAGGVGPIAPTLAGNAAGGAVTGLINAVPQSVMGAAGSKNPLESAGFGLVAGTLGGAGGGIVGNASSALQSATGMSKAYADTLAKLGISTATGGINTAVRGGDVSTGMAGSALTSAGSQIGNWFGGSAGSEIGKGLAGYANKEMFTPKTTLPTASNSVNYKKQTQQRLGLV